MGISQNHWVGTWVFAYVWTFWFQGAVPRIITNLQKSNNISASDWKLPTGYKTLSQWSSLQAVRQETIIWKSCHWSFLWFVKELIVFLFPSQYVCNFCLLRAAPDCQNNIILLLAWYWEKFIGIKVVILNMLRRSDSWSCRTQQDSRSPD